MKLLKHSYYVGNENGECIKNEILDVFKVYEYENKEDYI